MSQNWIAPWMSLWGGPRIAEPLSGDVSQWFRIFSPSITVEGKGDPDLEGRIVRDVATYGAQIGQISEIVLALANGSPPPTEAVAKLTDIVGKIAETKAEYRKTASARIAAALDDLKTHDKDSYDALVASLTP